jgi:hypothetical protein
MAACLKIIRDDRFIKVPLKPDTNILFNKRIAEILEFDKTSNTYSYTIDVPESERANELFEWAEDLTHNSPYRGESMPCVLESSGVPLKGYLKLLGHEAGYYKTQFISGTFNWWLEVGDKPLCELPFTETIAPNSFQWQDIFAPAGFSNDDTAAYVDGDFPAWASLKGFGKWADEFVTLREMQPDFYARALILKIFAETTFEFSSKFLSTELFRKVLIWISPNAIRKTGGTEYSAEETKIDHHGFGPMVHIDGPSGALWLYDNGDGTYTVPVDGDYNIRVDYELRFDYPGHAFAGADWLVNFSYTVNGGVTYIPFGPDIDCVQDTTYTGYVQTGSVNFSAGDVIKLYRYGAIFDPTAGIGGDPADMHTSAITTATFGLVVEVDEYFIDYANTVTNAVFPITDFIRCDVTCGDLLRALIHMFNLQVDTNIEDKKVLIEPYNDFYLDNSDYDDWTDVIDCKSRKTTFVTDLKRATTLKFKDESSDPATRDLYAYTYSATKKYQPGTSTSENPLFSPSANNTDYIISTAGVVIPRMWNGSADLDGTYPDKSYSFNPRVFFKLGYQAYAGENWKWTNDTDRTRIPKALQVGQGAQLGFSDILFADYYAKNFIDIENGDTIEVKVAIDFNLFAIEKFRKPKMIRTNGQVLYYRLLSIDGFDPDEKKLTTCVFQVWKR